MDEDMEEIRRKPLILPPGTSSKSVKLDGDLSSTLEVKSTTEADTEKRARPKKKLVGTAREKTRRFGGK